MKQPLTDESAPPSIALGDCLTRQMTWFSTNDPVAFWRTEAGPQIWTVRVNNFPEDHLYTLFINGHEIGDFDEWPIRWVRAREQSNPSSVNSVSPLSHGRRD